MAVTRTRANPSSAASLRTGNRRIVVADDSRNDHLILLMAAEESGIHVEFQFLDDGAQLIEHLSRVRSIDELPDLLVLDLQMPHIDGKRTLELLRANPLFCELPVVVLTSSSSAVDEADSMELGADAFYTKPSTFWATIELVKELSQFAPGRSDYKDDLRGTDAESSLLGRLDLGDGDDFGDQSSSEIWSI